MTVEHDSHCFALCLVKAIEPYIIVGKALKRHLTTGYTFCSRPFFEIRNDEGKPKQVSNPPSASQIIAELKRYVAKAEGAGQIFSVHSLRS